MIGTEKNSQVYEHRGAMRIAARVLSDSHDVLPEASGLRLSVNLRIGLPTPSISVTYLGRIVPPLDAALASRRRQERFMAGV